MTRSRLLPIVVALAVVLALSGGEAFAWPNCKEAVASDGVQGAYAGNAAAGFNYAIYIMLGTLFTFTGGIVFAIARSVRRADRVEGERE